MSDCGRKWTSLRRDSYEKTYTRVSTVRVKKIEFLLFLLEWFRCRKLLTYPLGSSVFITAISHRAARHKRAAKLRTVGHYINFAFYYQRTAARIAFCVRDSKQRADNVRLEFLKLSPGSPNSLAQAPSIRIRSPGKSWLRLSGPGARRLKPRLREAAMREVTSGAGPPCAHTVSPRDYVLRRTLALAWPRISVWTGSTGGREA